MLTVFVACLFAVPAGLVVKPLGGVGRPAVLVSAFCLFWWLCSRVIPGIGASQGRQPVRTVVLLFTVAVLASYAAAFTRPIPALEVSAADRGLITVLAGAGVTLLAADGIARRDRLDSLLSTLVVGASFLAALGIIQFTTGYDVAAHIDVPGLAPNSELGFYEFRSDFQRVAGTASHPIEFGIVLAMVLPLALHYAVASPRWNSQLRWAPVALCATAIPMSVTRTGVLGLITVALVLIPSWPARRRLQAVVVSAVFAVVMKFLVPGLLGTLRSLFTNLSSDPSYTGRTEDYEVVAGYVSDALLFGRGVHTFLPRSYVFVDNQYLLSLVETGFVGLLALIALLVVGASVARGARRRSADPVTRDLGQCLAASVAAGMVSFGTYDALSFPAATGVVFLVLGCAGALWRLEGGDPIRS